MDPTVYGPLRLAPFTEHNVFRAYPCSGPHPSQWLTSTPLVTNTHTGVDTFSLLLGVAPGEAVWATWKLGFEVLPDYFPERLCRLTFP